MPALLLRILLSPIRLLFADFAPTSAALAVGFGWMAGIAPLGSLHTLLILFVVMFFRVHVLTFLLSAVIFALVAVFLDSLLHATGMWILQAESLQGMWTTLYNINFFRPTFFNNSMVMGSIVIGFAGAIPMAAVAYIIFSKTYRQILKRMETFPTLAGWMQRRFRTVRWSGVAVFATVTVTLSVFFMFFADRMIETNIESYGSQAMQARIDLDDSSLRFSPAGFELKELQVTNPSEPMSNIVQVGQLRFAIDTNELMRMKVIVDEITLDKIRFNSPRTHSGAMAGTPKPAKKEPAQLPSLELPDAKDILSREPLLSLQKADQVAAEVDLVKTQWEKTMTTLPTEQTFKEHEKHLADIETKLKKDSESKDTITRVKAYKQAQKALKEAIKTVRTDIDKFKQASKKLRVQVKSVNKDVSELKKMPGQDLQRLGEKYNLSFSGLSNLSRLMFGAAAESYVAQARDIYQKLAPFLQPQPPTPGAEPLRHRGIDVRFRENAPVPDLVIRKGKLGLSTPFGELAGKIENISSHQALLGVPGTVKIEADKLQGVESIRFNAAIPAQKNFKITFGLDMNKMAVKNVTLAGDADKPLKLEDAMVTIGIHGHATADEIQATLRFQFNNAHLRLEAGTDSGKSDTTGEALKRVLGKIKNFHITAAVKGKLTQPQVKIKSDLDHAFNEALGQEFKTRLAAYKQDLQARIRKQFDAKLEELKLDDKTGALASLEKTLGARQTQGNKTLKLYENRLKQNLAQEKNLNKNALAGKTRSKRDRLKNKLKGKLKF